MKDTTHVGAPSEGRPLPPALQERLDDRPPEERAEYEKTWLLAGTARPAAPPAGIEQAWDRQAALRAALQAETPPPGAARRDRGPVPGRRPGAFTPARARMWRATAVAALAVLVVGLWFGVRPVKVSAPAGTTATVLLPDGSEVELNSGATLTYRRAFLGGRRVGLAGEAFFDVVPEGRPFVVETFNASVEVLGTRFNVRAWPEDAWPETVVVLASGAVGVTSLDVPGRPVHLEPGQMSRVPERAALPGRPVGVAVDQMVAWRTGGFAFNNQPLGSIFAELERRFGVSIEAPRALAEDSLVLFLDRAAGVEDILEAISRSHGLTYRAVDGGFEVSPLAENNAQ
jgi:ferric-dicitrate binding protein FerR (iron transport regulator)